MKAEVLIALTTCPDEATARRLAETLIGESLAACVNLIPAVTSVYRWQGKIEHAAEVLLVAKTTSERMAALQSALRSQHPYELPEIIAVPVSQGFDPYLDWVRQECTPNVT
jgi:periplasmic divalent cation tolerance protein